MIGLLGSVRVNGVEPTVHGTPRGRQEQSCAATKKNPPKGGVFKRLSSVRGGRLSPTCPATSGRMFLHNVREFKSPLNPSRRLEMTVATQNAIVAAVTRSLSPGRMSTYKAAAGIAPGDDDLRALSLYAWNAEVSGALLSVLHICEVVTRNAVADAIAAVYGAAWPWSPGFEQSLSNPQAGYNPRNDLFKSKGSYISTGKVIPELTMMFWVHMFTRRFDHRIWDPHLRLVLPHLGPGSVSHHRSQTYQKLDSLRRLRNRIAHHEPILNRNLPADLKTIHDLIKVRCPVTERWVSTIEHASTIIAAKP